VLLEYKNLKEIPVFHASSKGRTSTSQKLAPMLDDPPPQPPGRKLEDIPTFMRKKMPADFPENSHLPLFQENAPFQLYEGTQDGT
jgi:hypothetical protein